MKKSISILLVCLLTAGLAACGNTGAMSHAVTASSVKVTLPKDKEIIAMTLEEAQPYYVEETFDNSNWQDYLVREDNYHIDSFMADDPSVSVTVDGTALCPLPQYALGFFKINVETSQTQSYSCTDGTVTEPWSGTGTMSSSTVTGSCQMVWPDVQTTGDVTYTYTYSDQTLVNVSGSVAYYNLPEDKINTDEATGLRYAIIGDQVYCYNDRQIYHYDAASGTVTDFPD